MDLPKTISILNFKGGVGKTILTYNLAFALEYILNSKMKIKSKILIVDNDPQASLTTLFYQPEDEFEINDTIAAIYDAKPAFKKNIIKKTENPNIDLLPNIFFTAANEKHLISNIEGHFRLKTFIKNVCKDYSIVLIDCAPSFSVFTSNALIASKHVVIPTILTRLSSDGILSILEHIRTTQENINPNLNLLGILINAVDNRLKNHVVFKEVLYRQFSDIILFSEIHNAAVIQNAERKKQSVIGTDKTTRAYKEFIQLGKEILHKIGYEVEFKKEDSYKLKIEEKD